MKKIVFVVITLMLIMACTYKQEEARESLTARVDQFWEYMQNRQYGKAWERCSHRFKKDVRKEEFTKSMEMVFLEEGANIVSVQIQTINMKEKNSSDVSMRILYGDKQYVTFIDSWVFENGRWMFDRGGTISGNL